MSATAAALTHLVLGDLLLWMREHGSSVQLNWGEDTGQWECSWITGGERFTGVAPTPRRAADLAISRAAQAEA